MFDDASCDEGSLSPLKCMVRERHIHRVVEEVCERRAKSLPRRQISATSKDALQSERCERA